MLSVDKNRRRGKAEIAYTSVVLYESKGVERLASWGEGNGAREL